MKVLCLGGGPAGLYFAISMKLRDPSHQVTVLERNRANDTFGWGVVLSDDALVELQKNDPVSTRGDPRTLPIGTTSRWSITACAPSRAGTALPGSGAKRCWSCCRRARANWASICGSRPNSNRPRTIAATTISSSPPMASTRSSGANMPSVFKPDIDTRLCKFVWLGTHQKFDDAFTFIFEKTEHGWVWAHVYQFDDDTATFIVECLPDDLGRLGLRGHVQGRDGRHLRADLCAPSGRP